MWFSIFRLLSFTKIPRLVFGLMMDRRVPMRLKLLLPAAVAYIILPIDLLPDLIPALGRIDDLLVALLAVGIFLALAPRDVVSEHLRGSASPGGSARDNGRGPKEKVIEGKYRIPDDDSDEPTTDR